MGYLAPLRFLFVTVPAAVLAAAMAVCLAAVLFAAVTAAAALLVPAVLCLRGLGFALEVLDTRADGEGV